MNTIPYRIAKLEREVRAFKTAQMTIPCPSYGCLLPGFIQNLSGVDTIVSFTGSRDAMVVLYYGYGMSDGGDLPPGVEMLPNTGVGDSNIPQSNGYVPVTGFGTFVPMIPGHDLQWKVNSYYGVVMFSTHPGALSQEIVT